MSRRRVVKWLTTSKYAEFCGEWSDYHNSYRWQPLYGGNHRALGDAIAALDLLKDIAKAPIVHHPNWLVEKAQSVGIGLEETGRTYESNA